MRNVVRDSRFPVTRDEEEDEGSGSRANVDWKKTEEKSRSILLYCIREQISRIHIFMTEKRDARKRLVVRKITQSTKTHKRESSKSLYPSRIESYHALQ